MASEAQRPVLQVLLFVTGGIGTVQTGTAYYGNYLVYETKYLEKSRTITTLTDGTVEVSETIEHQGATLYRHDNGELLTDNIVEDVNGDLTGTNAKVTGILSERTATFSLGKFENNQYTADEETSVRGTIKVALAEDESVSATIDVIVGMEPYVLMDFEGHADPVTGAELTAEQYWTMHVGMSKTNGGNSLSLAEREQYRVMIRDTTDKGVQWPKNADGSEMNGIVSAEEDSRVRFGDHAMRLAWDFTPVAESTVAAADFGFSSMIYAHVVQPTKLGFWINVPAELSTLR